MQHLKSNSLLPPYSLHQLIKVYFFKSITFNINYKTNQYVQESSFNPMLANLLGSVFWGQCFKKFGKCLT